MSSSAAGIAASLAALLPTPWLHEPSPTELVSFVSDAIAQHGIFPSEEARSRRVPQITVFVAHCAPRVATTKSLELAAEFLFAFFLLNDHWPALEGLLRGEQLLNSQARFVRGWLARLRQDFGGRAERFLLAFEQYLRSLEQEKRYEAEPDHPTYDEYVDAKLGRFQWVATAPYIELWELSLGIEIAASSRAAADEMKALAVELSYIANDIGSLARDQARKNFVTLLAARHETSDMDESLRLSSGVYVEKAARLKQARELATQVDLDGYAELVCNIADGNLRATTLLAHSGASGRYSPAVRDCLVSLPLVSSE